MNGRIAQVEYFPDAAGEWRWRVVAANGEIVGVSSEGYTNTRQGDAERGFRDHVSAVGQILLYQGSDAG